MRWDGFASCDCCTSESGCGCERKYKIASPAICYPSYTPQANTNLSQEYASFFSTVELRTVPCSGCWCEGRRHDEQIPLDFFQCMRDLIGQIFATVGVPTFGVKPCSQAGHLGTFALRVPVGATTLCACPQSLAMSSAMMEFDDRMRTVL
jgi:hypothetical protein